MPEALYFTNDDEANRLLVDDPLALVIGFVLDQQVTVQTAFLGPLKLRERLGDLDAGAIAATDPGRLEEVFRRKPAIHRFPGSMAHRVHDVCSVIASEYDGDASRIWSEATDSDDLRGRLAALPGFGEMKVKALACVLARRFGVAMAEPLVPDHAMLGDVDSPEALVEYQAAKRAYKNAQRAAQA